jgi:hypothetical protein
MSKSSSSSSSSGAAAAAAKPKTIVAPKKAASTGEKEKQAVKNFDRWCVSTDRPVFNDMEAAEFCRPEMFHEYAAHLTYDHKHGNTQDNIMKATVLSYLSGVMASGKEKFGAENPGFFEVMGGNDSAVDAQNNWYTQSSRHV